MKLKAYLQLMRFNKPAGTLLLWAPTAWALWLANNGHPSFFLILVFLIGTVTMRAAGCIINDMVDREIDIHVERTQSRPLTSNKIQIREAIILLSVLLAGSLWLVLQLPRICFYESFIALAVTILYPFCKRFFKAPQLILGIAFSMGIPMAFGASGIPFNMTLLFLWSLNFLWVVLYDTLYAMADKADDLQIGVHSTAILFANYDRFVSIVLQLTVQGIWLLLAQQHQPNSVFYLCWVLGSLLFIYQQWLIRHRIPTQCLKAFSNNAWYGLIMWIGLCF